MTGATATDLLRELEARGAEPDACPQCASGEPITEPGSRFLGAK
jgi:hypothetical protein